MIPYILTVAIHMSDGALLEENHPFPSYAACLVAERAYNKRIAQDLRHRNSYADKIRQLATQTPQGYKVRVVLPRPPVEAYCHA